MMQNLSVIILTYNEELHIERALESVKPFASHVFVVDSYSSDRTVELARKHGAVVVENPFVNQARQFQWALDNLTITTEWVMRLDADEIIESDLVDEINSKLADLPADVVGINLKRKHIFMEHWVRFGGRYPVVLLRIWRHRQGRIEDRWMDEHILVWGGRTLTFNGGFADHNLNDLTFFTSKHNKYATREAIEILNQKLDLFPRDTAVNTKSTSLQTSLKRWIKDHIYNFIPFTVSAFMYFFWRYTFQLGFLDGRAGLVYHFLQGYWYRFLVGSKVMELEMAITHLSNKEEIICELSRLTGHDLKAACR